ncbi:MAG: hypothetical protein HKN13_06490, partial [Rhodothermales bacterium]|nr:hypothetical protein [Rhodothermales bacterium]
STSRCRYRWGSELENTRERHKRAIEFHLVVGLPHPFELALEPFAGLELNPVVGVPEFDREIFDCRVRLLDRLLDLRSRLLGRRAKRIFAACDIVDAGTGPASALSPGGEN